MNELKLTKNMILHARSSLCPSAMAACDDQVNALDGLTEECVLPSSPKSQTMAKRFVFQWKELHEMEVERFQFNDYNTNHKDDP